MIEIVFDEGIAANLRVIIRQSRSETEKLITFMNERRKRIGKFLPLHGSIPG